MNTIDKSAFPEIFINNEEIDEKDLSLFNNLTTNKMTVSEKTFFLNMKDKVFGEFAPSADLILDERSNPDNIFIVRYYYEEFKIGQGKKDNRNKNSIYSITLADALEADLFVLINRHITLLEWLRNNNFCGVNYNGNFILNRK
ncbi:MAG: hypothetical protein MJY74_00560 [Bacteroidaceae bacterium]|nr:hypothetical protein [Bacteroidaceae bacterium]